MFLLTGMRQPSEVVAARMIAVGCMIYPMQVERYGHEGYPSQPMCAGKDALLRVRPYIIARRYT